MQRPSTAPANKSSIDKSHSHHRRLSRPSSSYKICVKDDTNTLTSSSRVYRRSSDIRDFTQTLLSDILPTKFKPLQGKNQSDASTLATSPECDLLKLILPHRPSTTKKKKKQRRRSTAKKSRSYPQTHRKSKRTKSSTQKRARRISLIGLQPKRHRNTIQLITKCDKRIMTAYEKYTFCDQVHDLFFKLKQKKELKQNYLKKESRTNDKIQIEESLRQRVLDESLRCFPSNQHCILTRSESNWLYHIKNIKQMYQQSIGELKLKLDNVTEYYSNTRSLKSKENVIRLNKKCAKLRTKLHRHLVSQGFDDNDIYDITQQITDFNDMMSNICSIELLSNNCQNKVNVIEKEVKLQQIMTNHQQDTLCGLLTDLQRIKDDKLSTYQCNEHFDIQSNLNLVHAYFKKNETKLNLISGINDEFDVSSIDVN